MVRISLLLLTLWVGMGPAAAGLITIDPDDYSLFFRTDLSTAISGVTLSTNAGGAVFAANWTTNPDNNAFAGEFGASHNFNWQLFDETAKIFKVSFDRPTDYVSLLTTTIPGHINNSRMQAFNEAGASIDFSTTSGGSVAVNLAISRPFADISYILAGNAGAGTQTVIESLRFNRKPIAEPGPAAFFFLGLMIMYFYRRPFQPLSS